MVVTRLLDFDRTLLIPDAVRSFGPLQNTTLTFYRGFLVSLPRKREMGLQIN